MNTTTTTVDQYDHVTSSPGTAVSVTGVFADLGYPGWDEAVITGAASRAGRS